MRQRLILFLSSLDFGILGISAIDLDGSLLDYDYHEVQVKRAIIESSRQTLLATDHSKFSRQAIVRLRGAQMTWIIFSRMMCQNKLRII